MYGRENPGKAWQLFMNAYLANAPKLALPTKQQVGAPRRRPRRRRRAGRRRRQRLASTAAAVASLDAPADHAADHAAAPSTPTTPHPAAGDAARGGRRRRISTGRRRARIRR